MARTTKFYIGKANNYTSIFRGYSWASGSFVNTGDTKYASTPEISIDGFDRIKIDVTDKMAPSYAVYYWLDSDKNVMSLYTGNIKVDTEVAANAKYFAVTFHSDTDLTFNWKDITYPLLLKVTPHYKSLKKQYKKENDQKFFRESIDGKVNIYGSGYTFIKDSSLEDKLIFNVYQNGSLYATATFNKTNCVINHFKQYAEVTLTANDKYTTILNKYKNTYDLCKMAIAKDAITLTKRCIVQLYVEGSDSISSYAGGTYWETEVNEAVDDSNALTKKYHFTQASELNEISLIGFNYDINTAFRCIAGKPIWNSKAYVKVDGTTYRQPCSIVFTKIASKNDLVISEVGTNTYALRDDEVSGAILDESTGLYRLLWDTYSIEIYSGDNGTGTMLYQSVRYYGNNSQFILEQNEAKYPMKANPSIEAPAKVPTPNLFNLGNFVIKYPIWGRMLCDITELSDGTPTYELGNDDFAVSRANYKRCIGLTGFDQAGAAISIIQRLADSLEPTAYGMDDYGVYFTAPYSLGSGKSYYPFARNSWGNTSLWVALNTSTSSATNYYERWCKRSYFKYSIKDCYHIGNVIKALLSKIDPDLKHEPTSEYSSFLYGNSGASATYLYNCQLYITQKTNVLKGNYDQAAQKAEVTLEQVMSMLRDCFRCYWFIDGQNRFRIEHVLYFINGQSYSEPGVGLDLTSETDKFNKKNILYSQQEVSYNKNGLASRYEFGWADDATDSMGNLTIDINNEYIQKDDTESIEPDKFSSDVDYMLFMPEDFAQEGFALLAANSSKEVPISSGIQLYDEKQYDNVIVTPQNYPLSWLRLARHYMYDMSGNDIEYNNLKEGYPTVQKVAKCLEHEIVFQSTEADPNVYKLIKTDLGEGSIESMSVDIDTYKVSATLSYTPK